MSCYATNVYDTGFVYISNFKGMQSVYLLPDGVDAKTALVDLIREYLSTMWQSGELASPSNMMDLVKNSTFATKSIAYVSQGNLYHDWIENPYQNCFYTERRNFVDSVVDNFRKMRLQDLEEIHPIVCL